MKVFLLFMILTLALAGCGNDKEGSENEISKAEQFLEPAEEKSLSFGYADDSELGFGEIVDIN